MPPLVSVPRTALHAWLPAADPLQGPLLAAVPPAEAAASSSSASSPLDHDPPAHLELFAPFRPSTVDAGDPTTPIARLPLPAPCHRIAWGGWSPNSDQHSSSLGVLATGAHDGAVHLYDPARLLAHQDPLLHQLASPHRTPVRGLDFSPAQKNLLATGAAHAEILVWDLHSPSAPFSPGSRSRALDAVTSLVWNPSVVHILASSSNSGRTVVWDLKSKREITALSWAAAAPSGLGAAGFGSLGGGGMGGSSGGGGHSVVRWHPENPTKLVTASDDDHAPHLLVWDLRNWKEPERVLRGHDRGILSLAFCPADPDLLLSAGRDGRTLTWSLNAAAQAAAAGQDPQPVAEIPATGGGGGATWTLDATWCPSNPSWISTSSLDGTLDIHPVQFTTTTTNTSPSDQDLATAPPSTADPTAVPADSFFESAIAANARNTPLVSLQVEPRWLRRPASVAWGFGGRLVRVGRTTGGITSTTSTSVVQLERRVTLPEQGVARADQLARVEDGGEGEEGGWVRFAEERAQAAAADANAGEDDGWALLHTLLRAGPETDRPALVDQLLASSSSSSPGGGGVDTAAPWDRAELHARVEALARELARGPDNGETRVKTEPEEEDSASALFGGVGKGELGANGAGDDDFLAQLSSGGGGGGAIPAPPSAENEQETAQEDDDVLPPRPFALHTPTDPEPDTLLTRAVVVGDLPGAVTLALALERYADALLLALQSGQSDLVERARAAYFSRRADDVPYLRVLRAVGGAADERDPSSSSHSRRRRVSRLAALVRDVDPTNWREALLLLSTYAAPSAFPALAAQLGARLQRHGAGGLDSATPSPSQSERVWRDRASRVYAAAGATARGPLAAVWAQIAQEEERKHLARMMTEGAGADAGAGAGARFAARAQALQGLVEKLRAFECATSATVGEAAEGQEDEDALHSAYLEYAELLAGQGRADLALEYVVRVPVTFEPVRRERVLLAAGGTTSVQAQVPPQQQQQQQAYQAYQGYQGYSSYPSSQRTTTTAAYGGNPAYGGTPAYGMPAYGGGASSYSSAPAPASSSSYNPYAPPPPAAAAAAAAAPPSAARGTTNAYNPYAPPPPAGAGATAGSGPGSTAPSAPPPRNAYAAAPSAALTNPIDDPYAPNPYAAKPTGVGAGAGAPPAASSAAADPYAPANPAVGLPAPPPIRAETPSFASGVGAAAVPPPPPAQRVKADGGWNDAPLLPPSSALRRNTPGLSSSTTSAAAGGSVPPPAPIASPFPNSSPIASPGPGGVPPPPPSRGATRTPAPGPPPPPMASSGPKFAPPPPKGVNRPPAMQLPPTATAQARVVSPPPPAPPAAAASFNPYAPPPPPPSSAGGANPALAAGGRAAGPNGFAPAGGPPPPRAAPPAPAPGPVYAAPPPPRNTMPPPPPRPQSAGGARLPPPPPSASSSLSSSMGPVPPLPPPPPSSLSSSQPGPSPFATASAGPPPPPPPAQAQAVNQAGAAGAFKSPPPPPPPQQQQQQQQQPLGGRGAAPAGAPNGPPPAAASASAMRSPPLGSGANGFGSAPAAAAPPPPPSQTNGPPLAPQSRPPAPPTAAAAAQGPPPPPPPPMGTMNGGSQGPPQPQPPQPQTQPRPAGPPKMKYPPGDRSHIPPPYRPVVDILTAELGRLRQVVPPHQGKLVTETEKRLNLLFDLLNNQNLSPASADRVLEICQAIAARDQAKALDLHFALITSAPPATDVAPFQAALKLLIQRMQPSATPGGQH